MDDKFLKEVVLPYFEGFVRSDIDAILYTPDSKILAISQKFPKTLKIDYTRFLGMSLCEISPELVIQSCNIEKEQVANVLNEFKKVAKINNIISIERTSINFIDVIPYKNSLDAFLVTHIPIFGPDNKIVAIQSFSNTFYLFGLSDYLASITNPTALKSIKIQNLDSKLSKRQHEILFLLLCNMTQSDISEFLGIKRGTVSTAINRLCEKFQISGSNTKLLLSSARQLGLHECIPDGLKQPRIIIPDSAIRLKYFSNK